MFFKEINLNHKHELDINHFLNRVIIGSIFTKEDKVLTETRNFILGRTEYFVTGSWKSDLFHECLLEVVRESTFDKTHLFD